MDYSGLTPQEYEKLTILLKLGEVYRDNDHYCFNPGRNAFLFGLAQNRILISSISLNKLIEIAWQKLKS
jgi:hypothetical protein